MAAKPVRFHEDADAEYENAFDWYLARSPHAAAEFAAELSRAVELIAQAPRRWAPGLGGTRRFLLRRFPFALVYRELPLVIQVLAVAHSHRRPGYWKTRL
jgi:plasmid stabilization system protein ParE